MRGRPYVPMASRIVIVGMLIICSNITTTGGDCNYLHRRVALMGVSEVLLFGPVGAQEFRPAHPVD